MEYGRSKRGGFLFPFFHRKEVKQLAITSYTPYTYNSTSYDDTEDLIKQQTQNATNMGTATSAADVANAINTAGDTLSTAKYQSPEYVSQSTQSIYDSLKPILSQQNASTNQQYNTSAQKLAEQLAATGANRGGTNTRQTMANEQNRNATLATNSNNMLAEALNQAIQQGQLGLSETNMLQNQAATKANQLASLLGQQESSNQWSTQFNANQLQSQIANLLAARQAQASESQYAANLSDTQQQTKLATEQAAANEAYQQQALAEEIAARQAANALAVGELTGTYNGGQTLTAQELANQIAQQAIANQYTEAGLTGTLNGEQTMAGQLNQASVDEAKQAQLLAQLQALLSYNLGVGEVTDSLPTVSGFNYGDAMTAALRALGYEE